MRLVGDYRRFLLGASVVALVSPAMAADLGAPAPAPGVPAPAAVTDTVNFEVSPEWGATGSHSYADTVLKLGWSHALGQGWNWGASVAEQLRTSGINQTALETTIGYGIKLSDMITLPVSAGVGYVWDGQNASSALAVTNWGYYLFTAGVNVKLDSHWTWNLIQARYRNAFQGGWVTPKVQTGVTYAFDSRTSVYANVGYSWKTGAGGAPPTGIGPDKISATVGMRFGF